jgi:hypothetical protein
LLQGALFGTTTLDPVTTSQSTTYELVAGQEPQLVQGLTYLVLFLWQGVAELTALESWSGGGLARQASWNRLLLRDPETGDYINLKGVLGEALAWWHEESAPDVAFAGRPSLEVGQPAIDSLSLLNCGGDYVVRAVQAKAGYGAARPRFREAATKFKKLLDGEFDSFWNDRLRYFRLELLAVRAPGITASAVLADGLSHFAVFIAYARPSTNHPARDYVTRVPAHDGDGRGLMLLEHQTFQALVADVATSIRSQIRP